MTPREGFIVLCYLLACGDRELHPKEIEKIEEVLHRYSFTDDEIEGVIEYLRDIKPKEALELGAQTMVAVCSLDSEMKKNLLEALQEIAEADEKIEPEENAIILSTKSLFEYFK